MSTRPNHRPPSKAKLAEVSTKARSLGRLAREQGYAMASLLLHQLAEHLDASHDLPRSDLHGEDDPPPG